MAKNNSLEIGVVYEFNGYDGTIVSANDTYSFNKDDVHNFYPKKGDKVSFYINIIPFGKDRLKTIKFIKLLNNEKTNDEKRSITK